MDIASKPRVEALAKAWELIDSTGAPMLQRWAEEARVRRPYDGLRIFHNLPLSIETVCKIHALSLAGAQVTIACTDFLIPATFPQALALIRESEMEYRPGKEIEEDEFDFYLDCCGELAEKPSPKQGIVELTRTGANIYQQHNSPVPILSVDDSCLKALETFYGTGDGFIRAFKELSDKAVSSQRFVVVGYGKVGQGVAYALQRAGATVAIIDICPNARQLAMADGFSAAIAGSPEADTLAETATVIVTATGQANILNSVFNHAEQRLAGKILANIGAENEIGNGFTGSTILAHRMPINFCLQHPTTMRYLDPSFYAHNLGVQLIRNSRWKGGYYAFPEGLDQNIVTDWMLLHNEPVDRIFQV